MEGYIGKFTVVFLSISMNIVFGLKYEEKEGYKFTDIQKSRFEVDVYLTINGEFKGETALFKNESHYRPYVVHTEPDSEKCLIVYPNTAIPRELRPACSTIRPSNLARFPDYVKEKCNKKRAYILHEHKCEDRNVRDVDLLKRSTCGCYRVYFSYSYFFAYSYDYEYDYYSDLYDLSVDISGDMSSIVDYELMYVYCY